MPEIVHYSEGRLITDGGQNIPDTAVTASGTLLSFLATAVGDPTADTATVTAALALSSAGGYVASKAGVYRINSTLLVPSGAKWSGVPGQRYSNGRYDNGTCLAWYGATGAVVLSFMGSSLAIVDGINVYGRGVANLVGVLIDSTNSPAAKFPRLENFSISQCGTAANPGYGVRVGQDAVASYQADTWAVRHGDISHTVIGISIDSANAGYQGIIEHLGMSHHARGIQIISSGNFRISDINFGGHGTDTPLVADIIMEDDGAGHGGTGFQVAIENCQTQNGVAGSGGPGYFLLVDASCSPDLAFAVVLKNNRINDVGIQVNQTKKLILIENTITNANVVLAAGSPSVLDMGTLFNGTGVRTVTDGVLTATSKIVTSATAAFVAGDIAKRVVAGGSGSLGTPVQATLGTVALPLGTLITAVYTSSTAPAWAASTAYAVGDVVRPSVANSHIYQCTTAGTTGGSEPTWPTTAGNTVADGSVTWTCLATGVTAALMDTAAAASGTGLSIQFDYGFVLKVGQVVSLDGTNGVKIAQASATGLGSYTMATGGNTPNSGLGFVQNTKMPLALFNGARDRALGVDSSGTKIDNASHIRSGSGAPTFTATAGDYYFRTDTPGTANQRIYVCSGGTTWTGIA